MNPILLLEDDPSFGYILSEYLELHQLNVSWVKSAEEAVQVIENQPFSLALLDIMLPKMNGFEFAQYLRKKNPQLPFIFISAKSLKIDQLKGYQLGAFDYITKPVDEELLVAKIKALLQRMPSKEHTQEQYTLGTYLFIPKEQLLKHSNQTIQLTARETELLLLLTEHKNKLMLRKDALQLIWGNTDEFSRKSMDVFISHLRKYLSLDSSIKIENVHRKGFILRCGEDLG